MKKILLLFCLLASTVRFYSQNWDWAKGIELGAIDIGNSIGIDKQNNLYIAGSTQNYWGSGGYYYPLFCKYSQSGNLIWRDTLPFDARTSATDSLGNTYFASGNIIAKYDSAGMQVWKHTIPNAFFKRTCINPVTGFMAGGAVAGNNYMGLLYSFDPNGNVLWMQSDSAFSAGRSIVCDSKGRTYSISFPIAVFDVNGNITFKSSPPNGAYDDLIIDNSGNLYMSGWFDAIPFTINGITYYANGNPDEFLLKYDSTGNLLWYKIFSGHLNTRTAISLSKNGKIYFTSCYLSLNADAYSIYSNTAEIFVMEIDSAGAIQWLKYSLSNTQGGAYTQDIIVSLSGDVFITGGATNNHDFDSLSIHCNSYPDMLLAKLEVSATSSILQSATKTSTLSIYPNPSGGIFTLLYTSSGREILSLKITNSLGQMLYSEKIQGFNGELSKDIDLGKQAKGIYFVEILEGSKRTIRKIVLE